MLRLASLLAAALFAFSCAPQSEQDALRRRTKPGAPTGTASANQEPAPVPAGEPDTERGASPSSAQKANVVITTPKEGQSVSSNPIRIEGRARTFENNVEIHIDNEHGQTLATGFTTARGELGRFNPFSAEVFLTSDPGSEITIIAIERSAKDGSVRTRHAVPVRIGVQKRPLRLFFPNANRSGGDCMAVERVVRDVPVSVSAARLALEALLRGPTQPEVIAGFRSPFPRGATVRSVNLEGGRLTVDFNEAMQNVGGSCRVQSIRSSIVRTMKEIPGIRRVVITAMGDEATALQP